MAKKLALAAALLALVALATATTYTTTMLDDNNEANPRQTQQCQGQVQGMRFQSCQRYFQQRSSPSEEDEIIEMTTENPRQQGQEQSLRQCCQELRNIDQQCMCEAIRQAVRQSQQQGQGSYQGGQQMHQIYQKAKNLPQRCGSRSPQRCEIRAIFL